MQVDSSEKLAEFCGITSSTKSSEHCLCAIVTIDPETSHTRDPPLSPTEQKLADFYECTLEEFPRPVIQLPR